MPLRPICRPLQLRAGGLATALLMSCGPALAGTFDVKGPDVEKGSREIEVGFAWQDGFSAKAEPLRQSWEVGFSYGMTDWWKIGPKINLDQMVGDDLRATSAGYETTIKLPTGQERFAAAWFTEVVWGIPKGETNSALTGPIVQLGDDKLALTVNTFFQRTFGRNSVDDIDFVYAWRLKKEVREGLALGLEGYGTIPDIGHSSAATYQEHRIGPVVYFERDLGGHRGQSASGGRLSVKDAPGQGGGGSPKMSLEAGLLFGLTDATPDITGKVKLGLEF